MRDFLIRRLVQSVLLLWALMSFTFVLVRLTPGGPEAAFLEQPNMQVRDVQRMRERLGLADPLPLAYAKWMGSAVRLDFGRSYQYLRPPVELIGERIGATLQLGALAYTLALAGIPLGAYAAMRRGRLPDVAVRIGTVIGDAVPHWWLALVIIVALSSLLGWFPNGTGRDGPWSWFSSIIIPAMILSTTAFVSFARFTRGQVLEVLGQDYVRTARAKGLREALVTQRHVLRNALLPVVTLLGALLPALVSGAALTESIFNWPGMGRLFLEAAFTRDYPLLLAILTFTTAITLVGTLLADLAYGWIDPRIKFS